MKHEDKIAWMHEWVAGKGVALQLEGVCGFGRRCVGIVGETFKIYPDYYWFNSTSSKQLDNNGKVWVPEDAYHKHPCVAVLGRGEKAESQLFDWLRWFDNNNFVISIRGGDSEYHQCVSPLASLASGGYARMVKKGSLDKY